MPPTIAEPRPRSKVWLRVAQVLVLLLIVAIGVYIWQYVTRGRVFKATFERIASEKIGRPVRVAGDFQLYLDPNLRFHAEGLTLANPEWAKNPQLFAARRIDLDMPVWKLLFGEQIINNLVIDGGRIGLERAADGRTTWTFPGPSEFKLPVIDRAGISDTQLQFIDAVKRANIVLTFGDIAGVSNSAGQKVAGPLTFTGKGTAYGAPFTLGGSLTTPNEAAAGGKLGLVLHARAAETWIDMAGTLPGATRFDGADLRVTVSGGNLATPGKLFGIVLPATRPYKLAANLTKDGHQYRFTRIGGYFGDSDLAGHLTVTSATTSKDRLKINGVLSSKVLDSLDVGPFVGYSPEKLDAEGGAGAIVKVNGHPQILPDAPLASAELQTFDARIDYTAATVRTGTVPISALKLGLTLDHARLSLKPLAFDLAGGRLSSEITINAATTPVATDYDIRLSQVPLKRLLTSFNLDDAGATASMRGRVQLKGHGDTVHKSLASSSGRIVLVFPAGTLWVRNIELAKLDIQNFITAFLGKRLKKPTEIRCGIVAFTVTGGKAVADPILFDTTRANYRGSGSFDFADESLKMSIEGKSKEFSLFSGQSPIGINGWFAAPGINPISGELVARGGAAVALGVVATPLAAVLAFVDFGGEKNTDCGPILAAKRDTAESRAKNAVAKQ